MIEVPKLQPCSTVFVCGPVRSGKTTLLRKWIMGQERSLTFDLAADHMGGEYCNIWGSPLELCERLEKNPHYYRISYHPTADKTAEDFFWVKQAIWQLKQPRWLVIEECHEVCANGSIHPEMRDVLRYSRKMLLGVVGSSQRFADVDRLMTQSAAMIIMFHTTEPRDIEAIQQRFGKDCAVAVQNLRPCIFNDVTRICEQEPECVVKITGAGFRVVELGSKIQKENTQWLQEQQARENGELGAETPETPEAPSLEPDSGHKERNSSESLLEDS